jgi:hypothetical protein
MKTKKLFFAILLFACFVSCSSNRYIYSASPPNNPYFKEKGESKFAAYYSSSKDNASAKEFANGWDLQGAYAIGEHWALTASLFNRREQDVYKYNSSNNPFDSSVVKYKRNMFETGGGYFISVNPKKTITINLYGGAAFGKFSIDDNGINGNTNYNRTHSSKITKWFLQPSVNFMPGKFIRLSFSIKTSNVHYGNIQTNYTNNELLYFNLYILNNKTLNFIEPCWNFQFGLPKYPWVKLDWIISGVSNNLVYIENVRQNNVSIGLTFDFSKKTTKE